MYSWENLTRKSYRLSTSPVRCSHCTLGNRKKVIFNSIIHIYTFHYLRHLTRKQTVIHRTWKYHHTNLWSEGLLRSFRPWRLWKEPVLGCRRWLWKEPVVMFKVTTFCINTFFQSFSTPFSRVVHHAVLKFSPCHNKPLPQASTPQYMRFSCSVPQMQ